MKHLLVSRQFPPAPGGGIGVYVERIARLLAEAGETVHVIAAKWRGAQDDVAESVGGRLIVHRLALLDASAWPDVRPAGALPSLARQLFSHAPAFTDAFAWQASELAERLVDSEGIDLIEAQEYEAPLYPFLLRRGCGLGPRRRPPCFIHLHSPTEIIARHDDQDPFAPHYLSVARAEEYCIRAADGLLCPSALLARRAGERYALEAGRVTVVPLPSGSSGHLSRPESTWRQGDFLFIGRLSGVKGVREWAAAAASLAQEFPDARFRFAGANVADPLRRNGTMREVIERAIPKSVAGRFEFTGAYSRAQLPGLLAQARAVAIPSRWENFPYTCMEAMASGVPVLATACGGMAEMVEDGESGWIAEACDVESLVAAGRRALGAEGADLARMGQCAAARIGQMCGDAKVLDAHMEFRSRLVEGAATRSLQVPGYLSRGRGAKQLAMPGGSRDGIGVVVTCYNLGAYLGDCLASLRTQEVPPAAVVVVDDGSTDEATLRVLEEARQEGWEVFSQPNAGLVAARQAGVACLAEMVGALRGYVFLDADDILLPGFVRRVDRALTHSPQVGVVSCWVRHFGEADRLWVRGCPAFPYQWVANEAATFSAIRAEAFDEVGGFRELRAQGYDDWDLFNAMLAEGWIGVTLPEVLGGYRVRRNSMLRNMTPHAHALMREDMLSRFPDLVARDAQDIVRLAEAQDSWTLREELLELRARVARWRSAWRRPDVLLSWVWRRAREKLAGRVPGTE